MPRNQFTLRLSPELAALKERLDSGVEDLRVKVDSIVRDLQGAILDIEQIADDLENELWDAFGELETEEAAAPPETPDAT